MEMRGEDFVGSAYEWVEFMSCQASIQVPLDPLALSHLAPAPLLRLCSSAGLGHGQYTETYQICIV